MARRWRVRPDGRPATAVRRILIVVFTAGLVLLPAAPAQAHAALIGTEPANGAQLPEPPAEIRLRFSERVTVASDAVELRDGSGEPVAPLTAEVDGEAGTEVVAPLPDLDSGAYVVTFRVVSADSHPISGALTFGVGEPAAELSDQALADLAEDTDRPLAVAFPAARWAGYAGLALLAGGLVVLALCWPAGWRHRRARTLVLAGGAVSLVSAVAVLLLQGPYANGAPLTQALDPALIADTMGGDYGRYATARVGLVLLATGLLLVRQSPGGSPPGRLATARQVAGPLLAVALAATWIGTGHANSADSPLDPLMSTAHLATMAAWFGGLATLTTCLLPRAAGVPADELRPAVRRFSLLATGAVATLVTTGVYIAWRQVGTFDALAGTPYGRLLAFKLAAVGLLLWLGGFSRSVVQRRFGDTPAPDPANRSGRRAAKAATASLTEARLRLFRTVRMESVTAVAVLAVVAVLVATPPGVVATLTVATAAEQRAPVLERVPLGGEDIQVDAEGEVTVLVDPAVVGENRLVVTVTYRTGDPWEVPELRAALQLPAEELGPLPVELSATGPGSFTAEELILPVAGIWNLDLTVRTSDIDSVAVRVEVPVG